MIKEFQIFRLFTYNADVKKYNEIVYKESREFWRELVVHKFTLDEATARMDRYLAKFLMLEIKYKMIDDVNSFEELPELGNYEVPYTLSRHTGWGFENPRYFVFDISTGEWSPESISIY
jgi:hypothetical protein